MRNLPSQAQLRARELNFSIYRLKGVRALFMELGKRYKIDVSQELQICNGMLRKLRNCR